MSNQALPRPRFNAPEPERGSPEQGPKAALKIEARTTPLLDGKVSEIPDVFFGWAMRFCGVAVVALLGLIVYQLVVGSELSWHAFGWKFFGAWACKPVSDQYGALPFMAAVHFIKFELAMLAELGFGLDLENCAAWAGQCTGRVPG